jgi:hypothetical protein
MQDTPLNFNTLVIGSGPGGTGLLFNAIRKNKLPDFLDAGVGFIDKADNFCAGTIGKYIINSDTAGGVFLECLPSLGEKFVKNKQLESIIKVISQKAGEPVCLELVGEYLKLLGTELRSEVEANPNCHFFSNTTATSITKSASGDYITKIRTSGASFETTATIRSKTVVFAMGGRQEFDDMAGRSLVQGLSLKNYRNKIMQTDHFFTREGVVSAQKRLRGAGKTKVVVIGGSHSALSAIWIFLNKMQDVNFRKDDITLMHRSKLKLFYPSKEHALTEGYTDFTDDDICPLTGKVYRLAGLRLDSRELLKKIVGMNGTSEKRVRVLKIDQSGDNFQELKNKLDEAALIIPAFGYKPGTLPVFYKGQQIELSGNIGGPLVNKHCQVINSKGEPISGLYGIGLASGFVPWGELGGEPGFVGQTNGLWLYQNGVGEKIFDQIMVRKNELVS